jgi:TatD DNase family protein
MSKNALIDTHSHIYLEEFANDLPEIMLRAEQEGVTRIYQPSLDSTHLQAMWDIEKRYPGRCFSMIGIHPCYVKENYAEELEAMRKALRERSFVAVGEIGLDYYWSREFDNYQLTVFIELIQMAKQNDLPIVIHSRNSMDETINIIQQYQPRGIFHCFSGNLQNAMDIIDCGMLLGIGGVVTYKNAGLDKVVADVPLDKIVLETDAPYLTPVPFRGKRNESSYLKYIVAKIAEIKNISEEEVAEVTTANAIKIFG